MLQENEEEIAADLEWAGIHKEHIVLSLFCHFPGILNIKNQKIKVYKVQNIERWWEIIFCVYTMISLNSQAFLALNQSGQIPTEIKENSSIDFSNHKQWNQESGCNNTLNNLRLILQPLLLFGLIYP